MTLELFKIIFYKAFSWVGNIELPALFDFVEDDEVILVPVDVSLLAYSTLFFIVRIVLLERHFEFIDIVSQ